jgi:TolB-like protein/Tfp pilus assembly protein PilF
MANDDLPDSPAGDEAAEAKDRKKKDKVRSAWISFAGRIIAQVLGAVVTIVLGIYVLQRAQAPAAPAGAPPNPPRLRPAGSARSLAVLPLRNLSGDPQQEYFADGMTEALITDLAQIRGIHVISRTSSMVYKGQTRTIPAIAKELDVDLIVEGSVIRDGDRVRVTAQLIDAARDEHLWARNYDRTMRDVIALQVEVATAIASEVTGVLAAHPARFAGSKPVDPDAYDAYLRGRSAWNLRTRAGFERAIELFEQAIARAPEFALAHAGLADACQLLGTLGGAGAGVLRKGRAAAARALELDDQLGEAHASLAAFLHRNEGDLEAAEREFQRAIDLSPGYPTAYQWYAILLAEEGRDAEAVQHAERSLALDPLSAPKHQTAALVHYLGRRYERAIAAARRALELNPQLTLPRDYLARALLVAGQPAETLRILEAEAARPDAPPQTITAIAHWRRGDRTRADALVRPLLTLETAPLLPLARWYAAIGDREAALRALERAAAETPRAIQQAKADPLLDPVRASPRFAALVERARAARTPL